MVSSSWLTFYSQKIDDEALRSSSYFDGLDVRTQEILTAIINTETHLKMEIGDSISRMLCRLQSVNEDEHHKTRAMIAEVRNSFRHPKSAIEVITAEIDMLNISDEKEEEVLRGSVNRKLLQNLSYAEMTDRYEVIVEAYPQTFDWVFLDTNQCKLPWSDFGRWLRGDGGIYWINGKAGSGKSTLMKHIKDSTTTEKCMQVWSRTSQNTAIPYCIATFFFWNSGTNMQKSQQGLLRSLLFQVLGRFPELIPIVLPKRWTELYGGLLSLGNQVTPNPWSIRELHQAFERLIDQDQYHIKMCFLIDGLDEFTGDTEELCILFKRLERRPDRAKFCLSSRPWVEFQNNFEGCPNLRLQDITTDDIRTFVEGKFQSSPAFLKLASRDMNLTSALTLEIMKKAQGVFLWVKVVVELLLTGVNKRDSAEELWRRLKSFPGDLYPLFNTILMQIEPVHLEWASKTFQILKRTSNVTFDPFRTFTDQSWSDYRKSESAGYVEGPQLAVVELFAALSDDFEYAELKDISKEDLDLKCDDTLIHLTARCAGLLEVAFLRDTHQYPILQHSKIVYMHRTARDFVEQDSQWAKFLSYTKMSVFSPDVAMLKASVGLLTSKGFARRGKISWKLSPSSLLHCDTSSCPPAAKVGIDEDDLSKVEVVAVYAHYADEHVETWDQQMTLVRSFNKWKDGKFPDPPVIMRGCEDTHWLRESTLLGLSGFVTNILLDEDGFTRSKTAEILLHTLCKPASYAALRPFPKSRMVQALLRLSANHTHSIPNSFSRLFAGVRWPAAYWTPGTIQPMQKPSRLLIQNYVSLLEAFLKEGIDPTDIPDGVPMDFVLDPRVLEDYFYNEISKSGDKIDVTLLYHTGRSAFQRCVDEYRTTKTRDTADINNDRKGKRNRFREMVEYIVLSVTSK